MHACMPSLALCPKSYDFLFILIPASFPFSYIVLLGLFCHGLA